MPYPSRRGFLGQSAALGLADLAFLGPLGHAAAAQPALDPNRVAAGSEIDALVRLIRETPRDRLVPAVVGRLRAGLSYQDLLAALLRASLDEGDPHQVAQVYAAHRVAVEARPEERLLPLFWALDRVKRGFDEQAGEKPVERKPVGKLPSAAEAVAGFDAAMTAADADRAERFALAVARDEGPRRALARLLEYGARNVSGTLGHHPIVVANGWRTLDALGWQHPEPVLRYAAGYLGGFDPDRAYPGNTDRARRAAPKLPPGWAAGGFDRPATRELYDLLRQGDSDAASDLICSRLAAGKTTAGPVWDAVHLVAADLLVRYKTGGAPVGGTMIHAVTGTNALRFLFDAAADDRVRLLTLLQAAAALGDVFIGPARKDGELRDLNLLDLPADDARTAGVAEVFARLPHKADGYVEKDPAERRASDGACRLALAVLADPANLGPFQQAARRLLCAKATTNPHDLKYPVAAFEDAARAAPAWRPHLLAASVHALHGPTSPDARPLVQAREALR